MLKRPLWIAAAFAALSWGGSPVWAAPFNDVPTDSPFSSSIEDMQTLGVTDGVAPGLFGPEQSLTRGQFAKFAAVAFQLQDTGDATPFQDMRGQWAEPYVRAAYQAGLVNGTSDTTFSPDLPVRREEAAAMVWRFAKSKGLTPAGTIRLSVKPDNWAAEAVDSVIGHGWFSADVSHASGEWSYRPLDLMTRQEMAALLDHAMKEVPGSLTAKKAEATDVTTGGGIAAPQSSLASWQQSLRDHLTNRDADFTLSLDDAAEFKQIEPYTDQILQDDDYLHYIYDGMNYSYDGVSTATFQVRYLETKQQSEFVTTQTQAIVTKLLQPGMSQVDKEKAVHDYIVSHVAYDRSLHDHTAYGALTKGTTVCQGYALLTYRMLMEAGIENHIVEGNAGGQLHTWNLVHLNDGNWYHLDSTWDDPVPDEPGRVLYDYFNLTDAQIRQNHTWNGSYPSASIDFLTLAQKEPTLTAAIGLTAETPSFTADTSAAAAAILLRELSNRADTIRFRYKSTLGSANTVINAALTNTTMQNTNVSRVQYSNSLDTRSPGYTVVTLKPTYGE